MTNTIPFLIVVLEEFVHDTIVAITPSDNCSEENCHICYIDCGTVACDLWKQRSGHLVLGVYFADTIYLAIQEAANQFNVSNDILGGYQLSTGELLGI